jgi:hypothetical protein
MLFVGVIGASYQRPGGDMFEPESRTDLAEFAELGRSVVTV